MESMSLEVKHEIVTDLFRIYRIAPANITLRSEQILKNVFDHVAALPSRFKLIIIDTISELMLRLTPLAKMDFLEGFKEQCDRDRSIILTLDPHVIENNIRSRTYEMSDYYLSLQTPDQILGKGQIETRVVKTMVVTKMGGAERHGMEPYRFEIKPRVGIVALPFVQIKI
jgi:archaellum biogenesis ATPase FlaH